MKELAELHFPDQDAFRQWLEKNHGREEGFWMVFFKKHTGKSGITYREALEEALCFGWIDSIIRRLDEERYVRKFTPRVNTRNWSEVNKRIVMELIRSGRMREAGLRKIELYNKSGKIEWPASPPSPPGKKAPLAFPAFFREALEAEPEALAFFNTLSPSWQQRYIAWLADAKRPETREKRLRQVLEELKSREKPGWR